MVIKVLLTTYYLGFILWCSVHAKEISFVIITKTKSAYIEQTISY